MPHGWRCLASARTPEGLLRCLARGERDRMITLDGRVLMVSHASRSEEALARLAREALGPVQRPRVLVAGLGLGYTLRAALDAWPGSASFVVCELNPVIVEWCRGPLAAHCEGLLDHPRVEVVVDDVASVIRHAAAEGHAVRFDAILLDLHEGPSAARRADAYQRAHYSAAALRAAQAALRPGGVLAIWSEARDAAFEQRLARVGMHHRRHHPDRTARRHVVYVAARD